eukprot:scaffold36305_cov41-Attheya_sp.AAC.2
MSLELERAKQALETERKSHAETRRLLTESRTRTSTLECEHQKVLGDMEAVRAVGERDSNGLRTELRRSTIRVKAAEEDAQLALELAKDCAEAKQQVEIWLERALNEIQALRGQLAAGTPTTSRHGEQQRTPVVKFSDHVEISEPAASTPTGPVASFDEDDDAAIGLHDPLVSPPLSTNQQNPKSPQEKAMVSAGRDLLRRALTSTDTDGSGMASPARMSPERRRRLSERLSFLDTISNNDDDNRRSKSRSSSDVGHATRAQITLRNVTKLLRESGVRLDLGGRWWTSSSTTALLVRTSIPMEDVHITSQDLEAMARSYCQSVEANMGRQLEDNRGLQTLCNYLERKVVPIQMGTADEDIEECLAEMESV